MARSAGGVDLRIGWVHGVAGSSVAAGTGGGHRHPAVMVDTGMIIHKGAMAS